MAGETVPGPVDVETVPRPVDAVRSAENQVDRDELVRRDRQLHRR